MVEAAQDDCKANPKLFERLLEDAEKPLYPNCKNFTKLSALVKLYNLKGRYGWYDKSFSELLSLLGDMLPINNELPLSMYEAKKTLNALGMEYEKIHACPNDCILFRNELKDASSCPTCGASRWKVNRRGTKKSKGVPAKVMWYFPPIPRFKRMFQSSKIAKDLIWHAQGGEFDGKMRHPSDSPSWKVIDHRWPDFSAEPRNLRLAISADGINPHSSLSSRYSCWPVVMITYNLPPWLCMKRKFMILSLLISGPQQPGNDIDIYLAPLIEDLKTLWETGVEAYDAYQRESKDILLVQYVDRKPIHIGKTKDGLNSRLNLMDMGLRCELAPRFESNRTYLPPACYTLSRKEKKVFCQTLAELKVPEGYCSNFRNLVSMEDLKLYGLKSHDYHTLMQQLLPVALRSLLPKHVRHAIARLSLFFNALCKKVVDVSTLDKLQNELVVTLCLLEKYFPPSFFDIMIHLTVHLVREEAIEFCTEYLSNVDAIGVPSSTNVDHKVGAPIPGGHITEVDCTLLLQAHHYVLENTTIIQPYIEEHMKWLKLNNPRQSKRQKWLQEEHMRTFTHWLRKKVEVAIADKEPISETLRWMAHGPTHYVAKYHGYVIKGCQYNIKDRDELRVTQNSGVSIVATTMQISSAKDKNPVFGELCFYGIITEIWDLDYTMFRIPVFKCNWVDNKSGVKVDEFGLTLVDFTKMAHKSDPFVLASQAKQVFYVQDQLDPRWSVVLSTPERDFSFSAKDSDDFMDNSIEHHPLITTLAQVESFDTMDDSDVICIRGDCMDSKEEKTLSQKKYRGTTRKSMIIRNRNRGIKLVIKYNADGIYVGESSVHLTSYLGVLARTMVPIRYNTWRDVPEQLKDKLWDSIEIAFTLDKKSRRNCMLTVGKCFRSFKNTLTVKHILPFKDEPELLKKPPTEYHFIDDEDWNIFVKNRLSEKFQEYREAQKQRRKKHIYNHHLSRKGYVGLEEEMDELMKESQESGISYSGSNDILSQALGTPEYTGRVRAKGKHYTPGQYFNSMSERVVRDFLKATQERQVKFEADVLARLSQIGVATPQSDVSSSNMKSKLLLLPEVVEKPIRKVEEETLPVKIEPHMKLAVGTRENTVAGGTIVMDCGPNYLVVLDAPYESNTPLPIPIPGQATTVGAAVGYQVLWPTHLVNLSLMLNEGKAQGVEVPNDVFGESFKTFLMKEDMDMIISFKEVSTNCVIYYIWHLQKKLSDARLTERFAFINPALVSKAGMGETTKENRSRLIANRLMHAKRADYIFIPYNPDFHWVLVALDMRTMTAYYLDPMQKQPCDDLKEIVNMALRIHPPEKQRSSKREPTWVKVVCPRQLGSVECGYYVMRYMKDIIVDPSLLSTKMPSFQSSKSCRSHFDDSHKFSSHDK
ncbi:hypothetical protein CK203_055115 [Vitis vinifera]|uniref:Ubiquitin-like protease family profile domain-containing protein n=1 Tax=Vitis vinifera TaxID=29760 RepID=A0A438GUE3_VITVI|nr:hypothetical protein CK203_055115 [Vitis vinifera]